MTVLIKNCRLHTSPQPDLLFAVRIENGKISSIGEASEMPHALRVIDAEGRMLIPGLIDVHLQGAGGADVLDGTMEALSTISATLARTGTTSYLGTTVARPLDGNRHLHIAREAVNKNLGGATLLGVHLEGPFVNMAKKGGLDPSGIYAPSEHALDEIFDATGASLKMMTIAPELPGNLDLIRELTRRGVVASFAHSEATYEQTHAGFDAGIRHVTHIFNAMPPLNHRQPGPLAAIFERQEISAQIISDGHHLHPAIVRFLQMTLGSDRCVCITDGMAGIGLPDGMYLYNGREYESRDGAARYLDGTLIGSTMSLLDIAFHFKSFTGCTLENAIDSVTKNPARVLGLEHHKGCIEIGADADLVLIDADHHPMCTIVNGEIVYQRLPG
jgi:N-acetylglucosamine-6-phosphate deacetylase